MTNKQKNKISSIVKKVSKKCLDVVSDINIVTVIIIMLLNVYTINVNAQRLPDNQCVNSRLRVQPAGREFGRCVPGAELRWAYRRTDTADLRVNDLLIYDFGDGFTASVTVTANSTLPLSGLPAMLVGSTYSSTEPLGYANVPYHGYEYTDYTTAATQCFYRASLTANRQCATISVSNLRRSEFTAWTLETTSLDSNVADSSFEICAGGKFETTFNNSTSFNCNLTSLGQKQNGRSNDLTDPLSEHRELIWTFDFSTFSAADRALINVKRPATTNVGGGAVPAVDTSITGNTLVIRQTVTTVGGTANPTLLVPSQVTGNNPGKTFTVTLEIQNFCNRAVNKPLATSSINRRTLTYQIANSPSAPVVAQQNIIACSSDNPQIQITSAVGTVKIYQAFGANPTQLAPVTGATTERFLEPNQTPIVMGVNAYTPTGINAPGVYTYYVTSTQSVGASQCDSPVTIVRITRLGPLVANPGTISVNHNIGCVFSNKTFTLPNAPTDQNYGGTMYQTEYLWTVPLNYIPVVNYDTNPANDLTVEDVRANQHSFAARTADITFRINNSGGTNGYVYNSTITVINRFVRTGGVPACESGASSITLSEIKPSASISGTTEVCFGGTLSVTLAGYVPGRSYDVHIKDQNDVEYVATNVRLTGTSQNVIVTQRSGTSPQTNTALNVRIVRMVDRTAQATQTTTMGCPNDNDVTTQPNPPVGNIFTGTGSFTILPQILPTQPTTPNPYSTICPGENVTITIPNPPASIAGGRTTVIRYSGFSNLNFVSQTGNTITFQANARTGIGTTNGQIWRELNPVAGSSVCASQRYSFSIAVKQPPVLTIKTESKTICQGDNTEVTLQGNFVGVNPNTGTFSVILTNGTIQQTFPNIMRPAGGAEQTLTMNTAALTPGTYSITIQGASETGECSYNGALASISGAVLNTGTLTLTVRERLTNASTLAIRVLQGGREVPTIESICTSQSLRFEVIDTATGNSVVTPASTMIGGQTLFSWTFPPTWTIVRGSTNGSWVNVTAPTTDQAATNITVVRRYVTIPNCRTATPLSRSVTVVTGPKAAVISNPDIVNVCMGAGGSVTVPLSANVAAATEIGVWTIVSPSPTPAGVTLSAPNTANTNLVSTTTGSFTLRWSLTRRGAGCGANTDDIVVNIQSSTFTGYTLATLAGPDQNLCATDTADALQPIQLAGAQPNTMLGHSGMWTVVSYNDLDGTLVATPTGTFDDNTKFDAVYTLNQATPQYGTYVFRWTISATACSGVNSVQDDVTVVVNPRTVVNAISLNQGATPITINAVATPPTALVCITNAGLATANISLSGSVTGIGARTGSTVNWTASVNQAGVGIPTNTFSGTGATSTLNSTVRYTPRATDFGTTITFTLTSQTASTTPNTCVSNSTQQLSVTFVRQLVINNPNTNIVVCDGQDLNLIFQNDAGLTAGVTYNWRVNMLGTVFNTALPSPFNSPNTTNQISGRGSFSNFRIGNTQNGTYRARIIVSANANGCNGADETFEVTILPEVKYTPTQTVGSVCSGSDFTLTSVLSEYANVINNTGDREPIHLRYTIEDLNTTQPGIFKNPLRTTATRTNLTGMVTLLPFTAAGSMPTDQITSLTLQATNLELADNVATPRQVEITINSFINTPVAGQQCNGVPVTYRLTVNPKPIITPLARDIQVCSGQQFVHVPTTQMATGNVQYRWVVGTLARNDADDGVTGQSANNIPQANITQTITTTPGANGNQSYVRIPYIITPVSTTALGSCVGDPVTVNVIVLPEPILSPLPANTIICSGDEVALDVTNTNIDGIAPTATTYIATTLPGATPRFTSTDLTTMGTEDFRKRLTLLPATTSNVVSATIRITPTVTYTVSGETYSCASTPIDYNVRIAPVATITNTNTVNGASICDSGTFSYTPISDVPPADGTVDFTWSITAVTAGVNLTDFTVNGNAPTGAPVTFTGEGATITDAIQFNTPLATPVTLRYTITPRYHKVAMPTTANDYCLGTPVNVNLIVNTTPRIITVNPAPASTPITNTFSICSGEQITLGKTIALNQPASQMNFGIDPNTADIAWEVRNAQAGIGGVINGESGTGDFSRQVTNNQSTIQTFEVVFTPYVGTGANRCDGPTVTKTVTVNPGPVLATLTNRTICSIGPSANPTAATTTNNFSFTSPVTPTIAGTTFNYTVTFNDASNNKVTGVQVFNSTGATITLDNTAGQPHFDQATTNAGGALATTAGGATLANLDLKIRNNNTEDIFMFVVFRSTAAVVGGCQGPVRSVTYTINPAPNINNIAALQGTAPNQFNYELCSGSIFNFTPTTNVTQGVIRYKFTPVTPLPAGMTGVPTTQVIVSNTTANITFTPVHTSATAQYITLNAVAEVDGCDGDIQPILIKVDPTPTVALAPATTALLLNNTINICSGENLDLAIIGTVDNTAFRWTTSANPGISAINAAGNTVLYTRGTTTPMTAPMTPSTPTNILNSATERLINTTSTTQVLTYTITPEVAGGVTCGGTALNVSVTVHPKPVITNAPGAPTTICSGSQFTFNPTFNATGSSNTWQIISNSANNPNDVRITQGAATFNLSNAATPTISNPMPAGSMLNTTGAIDLNLVNIGGLPATIVIRLTPTINKTTTQTCTNTADTEDVTVIVQPVGPAPGTTAIRTINHADAFTYNPVALGVVNVLNSTYDWTAVVPAGVELRNSTNTIVTAENGTNNGINLNSVANLTTDVQDVRFTISTNLPISTCTTNDIIVTLHILPRIVVTITPLANTICFDSPLGITVTNNILNANSANLSLTYSWVANAIGINVRESGTPPVPVVATGNNVPLADIGTALEQKRLTIINPATNRANESVTYSVTATLSYNYTNDAGNPQTHTSTSLAAVSTVTVVPQPVSSFFQLRDNAGNYSDAGTNVNATTQILSGLCASQAFTFFVDPTEGALGTPGSTYAITSVTDTPPAGTTYGTPVVTVFDNAVFVSMPTSDIWSGEIRVVETDATGCVGDAKILQIRMADRPIAHAGPDITICEGDSVTLGRPAASGPVATTGDGTTALAGAVYQWQPNVFLTPATATPAPPVPNDFTIARPHITPTRTMTYRLAVSTATGCMSTVDDITITVIPKPIIPVIRFTSGSGDVCAGSTVVMEATTNAATTNVEWWFNTTNDTVTATRLAFAGRTDVAVSGTKNAILTINNISANGFYFAKAIGDNTNPSVSNCDSDLSNPLQVNFTTPHAKPTIAPTANGTPNQNAVCYTGTESVVLKATSSTVTVANQATTTYKWVRKNNLADTTTTDVNSSITDELTLTTAAESGFYAVTANNLSCTGTISDFIEVIIVPELSIPVITSTSGTTGVCDGGNITLVANVTEVTNGTVSLAELDFEWTFTRQGGTTSTTLATTGQQHIITNALSVNDNGNYKVRVKRKKIVAQSGYGRVAGSTFDCLSAQSRDFNIQVVAIPPTPTVNSTNTSPFCGDNGVSREFILNVAHPLSGGTPPQSYGNNIQFKWERKATATGTWAEVARVGTLRFTLVNAAQNGFYRVSAVNTENGAACESTPVEFPDEIVINDSPNPPSFTTASLNACETTTTAEATLEITNGTGPFEITIEVFVPNPDTPTNQAVGSRTTRTIRGVNNGSTVNLLNPDSGTSPIALVNRSTNIAVYTYTITNLVDANNCSPSSYGRSFELRLQPTPGAQQINAPVPSTTTPNAIQATIRDVADTSTPPNMIRTAFVCAGTTARFEVPAVNNTNYTWVMLPANTLTTAGQYNNVNGGSTTDNFVEINFANAATTNLEIQVTVTNLTTTCAAVRKLPITILGQTQANAGTDQSICPESKRRILGPPAQTITYKDKTYVTLGGTTANPTGQAATSTVPTSGNLTYTWRRVRTGTPAKTTYDITDLVAVPVSDFETGSDDTMPNPKVSPSVTSTYVVLVADSDSNCTAAQDAVTITVLDPPVISFTRNNVDVCITDTTPVNLTSFASGALPAGATAGTNTPNLSYSCDNCDDPNTVSKVGNDWQFDPTTARQLNDPTKTYGVFNIVVSYSDNRGCVQFDLGRLNIEIFQQPVLTIDTYPTVCETGAAFTLNGKVDGTNIDYTNINANQTAATSQTLLASQYRFTGPGVSYDTTRQRFIFDPAAATSSYNFGQPEQAHTITLLYKDARGCYGNSVTTSIVVKPKPVISVPPVGSTGTRYDFGLCEGRNNNSYQLSEGRIDPGTGAVPFSTAQLPGVVYSGTGVTAVTTSPGIHLFNPSVAGAGTHIITLEYTEQGIPTPCTTSITFTVTVHEEPTIQFPNFANMGSCATLFNLTTATVTPDLTSVRNVPNQPEGVYRDVSQLPTGYVDKDANGNLTPGAAAVIRELDNTTPPQVVSYQFDPSRVSPGYHRIRYDYKDGFGCENIKPTPIAQILILPPPTPILTPKDAKDTNPIVSARKPFSTICPNDSPFQITEWGSVPATGNTARFETEDTRLSALITTRTGTGGTTQYWFNPGELKNIAANIIDIKTSFSVKIKYIVTDTNGCEGFDTQPISVTPIPTATISLDNQECNGGPLKFTFNSNAIAPFKVVYIDDVNTPTQIINVPHIHKLSVKPNKITTYRIQKLEDRNGCVNLTPANTQATVAATPIADFNPNPLIATDPNRAITFNNASNVLTWKFKWDFGDGNIIEGNQTDGNINITHADGSTTTGTYVNPTHDYKRYGQYRVRLTASERICSDTTFKDVNIQPEIPQVDFTADVLSGCAPLEVTFTNTSKFVDTNSLVWNFGDNSGPSRKENPVYIFNKPGLYSISLIGTNQTGSIITKEKPGFIEVKAQPDAKFSLKPNIITIPNDEVQFTNLSIDADSYLWDLGDGTTSTDENPTHTYTKEGTYDIKLTATNTTTNCTDVFEQPSAITAISGGNIRVPNIFTPNPNSLAGPDIGNTNTGAANYDPNSINNNIFAPQLDGVVEYTMEVYDKWGSIIFQTKSQSIGWNGYYKGELLPTGVYVYRLKVKFSNGIDSERLGDISLIR